MLPRSFAAAADALTEAQLRRRRGLKWSSTPPGVLPAWVADMDLPLAEPVLAAVRAALDRQDLGYPGDDPGGPAAWADWCARRHGHRPDQRYVSQHADVVTALAAVIELLTEPGEQVVVPTPAYPPFLAGVASLGRRVASAPLAAGSDGRARLDLDSIGAALQAGARVVLLCSPHNPAGRAWERAELTALAELVLAYDGWLVSDEVHADLVLPGARHVPTAAVGTEVAARTVTLAAASKAFGLTGLKYALAAVPEEALHRRLTERLQARGGNPGILGAVAAEAAWRHGQPWLDAALAYLAGNRELTVSALAALPGLRWQPHEATYLAWLDLRGAGLGDDPAAVLLDRARVAVNPGHSFALPAEQGDGRVRLIHGTSLPLLRQVLHRIDAVLESS